jgi:uncharacterized HAD superfamily protein
MSEAFEKFQLAEYEIISKAHFEANSQIATLFRYFLLIASAPTAIFLLFETRKDFLDGLFSGKLGISTTLFIGFFLVAISIVGLLTCFYLISFRLDSVLYARTVNGIRKYFHTLGGLKNESHYRVLPKQTNQPKYAQKHAFSMIVWCIAFIDSVYFAFGTRIIAIKGDILYSNLPKIFWLIHNYNFLWAIVFGVFFFCIHLFYYWFISEYRNFSYMKTLTIGVDIDGVLNKHRDTFCTLLWEKLGITLWAEDITHIPVHTIPNINITRSDEYLIFNDPEYWKKQVIIEEGADLIIKELRNTFGYKIKIFSFRAWPDLTYLPKKLSHQQFLNEWWSLERANSTIAKLFPKAVNETSLWYKFSRYRAIHTITKKWLIQNGIPRDSLFLEKSGIDKNPSTTFLVRLFKTNFKNRFFYSKKYSYRYFVEDDLKNAIKLAANCEYVFLMNQPYNQILDHNLVIPHNIIRVYSWKEIKEKIKELG